MQISLWIIRKATLIKIALIVFLTSLLFLYTLPWILENALTKEYSGVDFHGYWYANHYTRKGINPYWALLNKKGIPVYWDPRVPNSGDPLVAMSRNDGFESELDLPIQYLDGPTRSTHPVAQMLIVFPAATAPLTLVMGLFSWLSWPTARMAWLGLNMILALMIPWLGFRLLKDRQNIEFSTQLILALAFYNFYGLRQCLVVGQQSIISLFLLLLALLVRDRWVLAGILLGFGLSKYSVGIPIFIFFLVQKELRIVVVSLIVQALGVLALLPLQHGLILETVKAYLKALTLNYVQEGIHLQARMPDIPFAGYLIPVIFIVAIAYLLKNGYIKFASHRAEDDVLQLNMLNWLVVGLFLAAYHRIHDLPFMIFFPLSILVVWVGDYKIPYKTKAVLVFAVFVLTSLLIAPTVPGKLLVGVGISAEAVSTYASENATSTAALLLIFGLSVWIQLKLFTQPNAVNNLESV